MAAKEFHGYSKLPSELKVMIWEQVFEGLYPGAHLFRLETRSNGPRSVVMQPLNNRKKDPSTWRRTHELESIDEFSSYVFSRNDTTVINQDTRLNRKVNAENNPAGVRVNLAEDLFIFKLCFGGSLIENLDLRSTIDTRMRDFAGITRIGFNVSYVSTGWDRSAKYKPFMCPCGSNAGHHRFSCEVGICNFLEWFIDLETVYFIVPLRVRYVRDTALPIYPWQARLNSAFEIQQGRLSGGRSEIFLCIKLIKDDTEHALRNGLDMFRDGKAHYCQIHEQKNSRALVTESFRWIFAQATKVASKWTTHRILYKPRKPIQVKILVSHAPYQDI